MEPKIRGFSRVLLPEEMRAADRRAMEKLGVPSIVLMENAARAAFEILLPILVERFPENPPVIVILCGPGNNGGDGFALARHLARIAPVRVLWTGDEERMSPETRTNLQILQRLHISTWKIAREGDEQRIPKQCDVLIDALLGIGGSGKPRGIIRAILRHLQTPGFETPPKLTVAIDIPTGVDAETGKADPLAIRADVTITMGALKTGLLLNDGPEYCGKIFVANLGIPDDDFVGLKGRVAFDMAMVCTELRERKARSTKRDYGRVVVIGGQRSMPGAPALAANAAIAAGAGLVRLFAPSIHPQIKPEIITVPLEADSEGTIAATEWGRLKEAVRFADAVVLGPGLGETEAAVALAKEMLQTALEHSIPIVVDADGLRAVPHFDHLHDHCILTPHLGEFERITQEPALTLRERGMWLAEQWASRWKAVLVLKDVPIVITDGQDTWLHPAGNPGMATAGSGDVLSGILGGLLAQKYEPFRAAVFGVALHQLAGRLYVEKAGFESLTASALIATLPEAFATIYQYRHWQERVHWDPTIAQMLLKEESS